MPYKDHEEKRAKGREYDKAHPKRPRNTSQGRKHMKDRDRPKFKIADKGGFPGGLTKKEIDTWCDRITVIRASLLGGVFTPEVRRWRDST